MESPNDVWTLKGEFRIGTGAYCYPLTVPHQILTDNGQPFASTAVGGLARLSAWWVKLGIQTVRIQRGHPEQNGRHERLHRTLKAATARPPKATMPAQQRAFTRFRQQYNDDRPHEALGQRPPAAVYRPSQRCYPSCLPPIEYPSHFETRAVGPSGAIHWKRTMPFIGKALRGETVGLEEVEDGIWSVYFGPLLLARFNERLGRTQMLDPGRQPPDDKKDRRD